MKTKSLSLFSAETLDSIAMAEILGGQTINNCNGGNCGNCSTGCGGGPTPQPNNYFICAPIPVNVYGCFYVFTGCGSGSGSGSGSVVNAIALSEIVGFSEMPSERTVLYLQ